MTKVEAFTYTNTSVLHGLFRTVFFLFKIIGCYTGDHVCMDGDAQTKSSRRARLHLHKAYCVLTNLCFSLYSSLLLYKLTQLQPMSSSWMNTFAISSIFIATTIVSTMSSLKFRSTRQQLWIQNFCRYETKYGLNDKLKRLMLKVQCMHIIAVAVFLPGCVIANALFIVNPGIGETFIIAILPAWLNYTLQFFALTILGLSMITFLPLIILGSICICYEFEVVSEKMKDAISILDNKGLEDIDKQKAQTTDAIDEPKIGDLYKQHDHVCVLLFEFNECINHVQLIDFFLSLPLACVMLYFFLTSIESVEDVMISSIVMIGAFLHPVILCWVGSKINLKAHEPLQYLWKIHPSAVKEKTARELIMFTSKLIGPPIGYSVYDLFTVTLPVSLVIAGTLLTYFVVVIQSKPSDQKSCRPYLDQHLLDTFTNLLQNLYNTTCLLG